jgi:hypothetical protein
MENNEEENGNEKGLQYPNEDKEVSTVKERSTLDMVEKEDIPMEEKDGVCEKDVLDRVETKEDEAMINIDTNEETGDHKDKVQKEVWYCVQNKEEKAMINMDTNEETDDHKDKVPVVNKEIDKVQNIPKVDKELTGDEELQASFKKLSINKIMEMV